MPNKKILILCTGNSCRSQMAEGILKTFGNNVEVYSAGTSIAKEVHPYAIEVMKEIGIDISKQYPKSVSEFLDKNIDFVITVCDDAKENCPVFTGNIQNQLHISFRDPAKATGSKEEVLKVFREVRDEIYQKFKDFYERYIK